MVSVLDSEMNSLGSSPFWEHCAVFLGKTLSSLHSGVKMGTCKLLLGEPCDGLLFYPGDVEILLMLQKTEISSGLLVHLACMQTNKKRFSEK